MQMTNERNTLAHSTWSESGSVFLRVHDYLSLLKTRRQGEGSKCIFVTGVQLSRSNLWQKKFDPWCLKNAAANYTESKDNHAEKGNAEIHWKNSWNQLSIIKDQSVEKNLQLSLEGSQ